MKNPPGRPAKGDGPAFPHDTVDHLLVHGETAKDEDGSESGVRYPSYRELGERYGVAHSLIAKYAKEHNCLARREQSEKRVREMSDVKLAELRAHKLAINRDDAVRSIDRFLIDFEVALDEGRVRCDNPSDFNLMVRLKAFIMGEADSRHEQLGGITLEDMQVAHARLLKTEEEIRQNPAITGMISYPLPASLDDDDDGGDNGNGGNSGPLLH
jgi:hypothetical protein